MNHREEESLLWIKALAQAIDRLPRSVDELDDDHLKQISFWAGPQLALDALDILDKCPDSVTKVLSPEGRFFFKVTESSGGAAADSTHLVLLGSLYCSCRSDPKTPADQTSLPICSHALACMLAVRLEAFATDTCSLEDYAVQVFLRV